jgi:hypothetical protein
MVLQIWHQDQVDSLNRDEVSKIFLPWLLKITHGHLCKNQITFCTLCETLQGRCLCYSKM